MGVRRVWRKTRDYWQRRQFVAADAIATDLQGSNFDKAMIATVAFNRPDTLEWQIHLVREHLAERDGYIVFDNSNNDEKRAAIFELCLRERVPYVRLPHNPMVLSNSHGIAMNWITRNFVSHHRPEIFGFLDHDIFPLGPFSVAEKLAGKVAYGCKWGRSDPGWFLWAGFCFYSREAPVDQLSFNPSLAYDLDTGGENWPILYRSLAPSKIEFATVRTLPNGFQYMDGWLHAGNASGWNVRTADRRGDLLELLKGGAGKQPPSNPLWEV